MLDSKERGPINIGNPVEFTMLELAEIVLELTSSKSKIAYKPLPSDDPLQRCPDIAQAQNLLNWSPTVELREGLGRTIDWFQRTL
jgi:nucleoside-diphosphate-sugar epimerase